MHILVVTNMYPTPARPAEGTFVEQQVKSLRREGLQVDTLLASRGRWGPAVYLSLPKRLKALLGTLQPDLVHVMYGGVMAALVTRRVTDRPVVVSFCGTDLLGGDYFNYPRRLVVKCGVYASRTAAARAAGIIVKSRELAEALPGRIDSNRVWIIPNGVDLARFRPLSRSASRRQLGWKEGDFHALIAAHPGHKRKRVGLAREAVALLRREGKPVQLHLLQNVPHEKVPVWLNASDVVIVASIHEGSPNIVKEALACDRPIVSTDVGDVRERIADIEGCFLTSPSATAMAQAIRSALDSKGSLQERERMRGLSLERVAGRLVAVYAKVLKRSG